MTVVLHAIQTLVVAFDAGQNVAIDAVQTCYDSSIVELRYAADVAYVRRLVTSRRPSLLVLQLHVAVHDRRHCQSPVFLLIVFVEYLRLRQTANKYI